MKQNISIFWFRRDLRLRDNAGLYQALKSGFPVLPIFIFDSEILQELPKNDARVSFIHNCLEEIREQLAQTYNTNLALFHGKPDEVIEQILETYNVKGIYTNKDYEPYALKRDSKVAQIAANKGVKFRLFKDQVIFEEYEITKDNGDPYVVYTPYKNKWKSIFNKKTDLAYFQSWELCDKIIDLKELPWVSLQELGFDPSNISVPPYNLEPKLIANYESTRNYPSKAAGTSRIGPHLRFGTISVREAIQKAVEQENETFWNELIWREFFMQILWHFPHTVNKSFKPKYDRIPWRNDPDDFIAWKSGKTGYTLVDAGMRELNTTGYMHNRVRMLVASFLCKHLLIDWRWGEAYFAEKLLDYELSSNVGNWQWAAGSGVDAAPYFRIFNPYTQAQKFDGDGTYIARWVPEFNDPDYGPPIVEHKFARERCLKTYRSALNT